MAIPPTSESVHAALIDGDQMSIVELRESDPELVALVREDEDSEVAAGRKGKRTEYRCAACGYGIVAYGRPPVPLGSKASDVASTRLPRQRPRSRSATR